MQVQNVNNNITFTSGTYFSDSSSIIFNKTLKFVDPKGVVKTSQNGYKYVEDLQINNIHKNMFLQNDFIKNLSEKFDTFIWFRQIEKNINTGVDYIATARIWWADITKSKAQSKDIKGFSHNSAQEALENMFKQLII